MITFVTRNQGSIRAFLYKKGMLMNPMINITIDIFRYRNIKRRDAFLSL
jgi:hypothetical protein